MLLNGSGVWPLSCPLVALFGKEVEAHWIGLLGDALTLSSPTLLPGCNVTSCLSLAPRHSHRHLSNCKAKINTCLLFLSGSCQMFGYTKGERVRPWGPGGRCSARASDSCWPQPSLMLPGKLPCVKKTKEQTSTAFKLRQFLG